MATRTFSIDIVGKATSAIAAFGATRAQAIKTNTVVSGQMASMSARTKTALLGLGTGGILAGIGLFKIGQKFDEAQDIIRRGTGKTGKALEGLQKDFKNVVREVPADFDQAATAVADLNTRLGITGEPLSDLAAQFTELSRITDTDLKSNVQTTTRLFKDWGVKTKDMPPALDQLFRASQQSGIEIDTLSKQMVDFGAPLRMLGIDFETAMALFSGFEASGIAVEKMMPGLKLGLKNLAGGGTDKLNALMKDLGINLKDPEKGLQDMFRVIKEAPSGLEGTRLAMEFFGQRAGPDMAAAIREGKFAFDDIQDAIVNGTDTIRQAGKETMTLSDRWTLFKNRIMVQVEPIARKFFKLVEDFMTFLSKPAVTKAVLGIGAAFGAMLAVGVIIGPLTKIGIAIGSVIQTVGSVFFVVMRFVNPVTVAIAAAGFVFLKFKDTIINALLTARDFVVRTFRSVRKTILDVVDWVVPRAKAFGAAFMDTFRDIKSTVASVWRGIIDAIKRGIKIAIGVFETVKDVVGVVRDAIGTVIDIFKDVVSVVTTVVKEIARRWRGIVLIIQGPLGIITTLIADNLNTVVTIFKTAFRVVAEVVKIQIKVISAIIRTGIKVISGVFKVLKTIIVPIVRTAFKVIAKVIRTHVDIFKTIIKTGFKVIKKIFEVVKTIIVPIVRTAFKVIAKIIRTHIDIFKTIIRNGVKAIKKTFEILGDLVKFARDKVLKPIRDIFKRLFGSGGIVRTIIKGGIDAVKKIWEVIDSILIDPVGTARDAIKRIFGATRDFLVDNAKRIRDRLREIFGTIRDRVLEIFRAIRDRLTDIVQTIRLNVIDKVRAIKDGVLNVFTSLKDRLKGLWDGIKEIASSTWDGIVSTIKGSINSLIRPINAFLGGLESVLKKIPGLGDIEVPRITELAAGGVGPFVDPNKSGPFVTSTPRAIVGEGSNVHPEYVIPTDPRFRNRAQGLTAALAQQLGMRGVPGMFLGGAIGSLKDVAGAGAGWVKDRASDLVRGIAKAAYTPIDNTLRKALDALPNIAHMRDIAQGFREVVKNWIGGADGAGMVAPVSGRLPMPLNAPVGAGVEQWRGVATEALQIAGQSTAWINDLLTQMRMESGGNPRAINRYDINWQRGYPSVGLMQVIGPTYQAYKHPSYDNPPYWYGSSLDPMSNILASIRYTVSRYGDLGAWGNRGFKGYAAGGIVGAGGGYTHPGEMVLNRADQHRLFDMIGRGGISITMEKGAVQITVTDGNGRKAGEDAAKGFMDTLTKRSILTDARIS